jgi:F-type H+-transporting ATPase subunit b
MAEEIQGTSVIEVASAPGAAGAGHGGADYTSFSTPMMAMTWVTFLITAAILYKVAWKPILRALDARESKIRKSVEDAEKARKDAAETEARCRAMLAEAQKHASQTVENAMTTAEELARTIEARAREESSRAVQNARREIEAATVVARETLRRESADLAIAVANKLMNENMDTSRNRELAAKLAGQI